MRKTIRDIPPPDDREIGEAIGVARCNWEDWQTVFEHVGGVASNPLLVDRDMFKKFVREYSVGRTIREGTRDDFVLQLQTRPAFTRAIADDSATRLCELEKEWRKEFGTQRQGNAANSIISVLSKVAAFVRPARFLAWDGYAKKGLNVARGAPKSYDFHGDYGEYLAEVDKVWSGELGKAIRAATEQSSDPAIEKELCFQRRVLDCYLMKVGGRGLSAKSATAGT